jgi:hypothetical protein
VFNLEPKQVAVEEQQHIGVGPSHAGGHCLSFSRFGRRNHPRPRPGRNRSGVVGGDTVYDDNLVQVVAGQGNSGDIADRRCLVVRRNDRRNLHASPCR